MASLGLIGCIGRHLTTSSTIVTSDIFSFGMSQSLVRTFQKSAYATFQAGQVASVHAGAPDTLAVRSRRWPGRPRSATMQAQLQVAAVWCYLPRKFKLPLARVGLVATGKCGASGILLCALRGIVGLQVFRVRTRQ